MTPITRRNLLSAAALVLPLPFIAGCTLSGGATSFDMAKIYANDLTAAVAGAATAYLAGSPAPSDANVVLVNQIVNDLQAAVTVLNAAPPTSDVKSTLLQIVTGVQDLAPLVSTLLGSAAPYVPLALAVIQAFIDSLPPPPLAPPVPPAALSNKAKAYRASPAGLHRAAMNFEGNG